MDARDRAGDDRDRQAHERDQRAEARDLADQGVVQRASSSAIDLRRPAPGALLALHNTASDGAAADREASASDRHYASLDRQASAEDRADALDGGSAVAAHNLLNSSAVVLLGTDTLAEHWGELTDDDRTRLLKRVHVHAVAVDRQLRELIRGNLGGGPQPTR
jgi:hypothetical protein